ncbi:hypothetical protein EVAR_99976_1 [Eumeta japonica]|uniref:Uncharacterized protein n=1 Tax=Eumeta variegata TaxID=151549 RepID=A0A4C1ZI13_EUMVA|nr:hypothetical protein EVAR_99976_1 [Eumeta japonica]
MGWNFLRNYMRGTDFSVASSDRFAKVRIIYRPTSSGELRLDRNDSLRTRGDVKNIRTSHKTRAAGAPGGRLRAAISGGGARTGDHAVNARRSCGSKTCTNTVGCADSDTLLP